MRYHLLGTTGMRVSALCMGTMTFGRESSLPESRQILERCREVGINFVDTADIYSEGRSETIVGECLKDDRDRWIVATKACQATGAKGPNDRGASRRHLRLQVEASLRRLQMEWIDLFYVHIFDPDTGLDETMRALDDLVREGKVLSLGVSNFSAWQTMKANGIAGLRGSAPIQVIQPMYSLLKRQAEVELLPMAASEGLAVVPYSPLGGGMLTGKYLRREASDGARLHAHAMYAKRYGLFQYSNTTKAFVELAQEIGVHPVSLAIAWVLKHPHVTAPILGARDLQQLEPCLDALALSEQLDDALYQRISALSPTPPPATDRLETQSPPT